MTKDIFSRVLLKRLSEHWPEHWRAMFDEFAVSTTPEAGLSALKRLQDALDWRTVKYGEFVEAAIASLRHEKQAALDAYKAVPLA